MSAQSMVDPAWAAPPGTWIQPIDGWGFVETVDGRLAEPFQVRIDDAGVDLGDGVSGWRGKVISDGHKYAGLGFTMSPRHSTWTGIVVIGVGIGENLAFHGMAETRGLECGWL